jgi:lipoate-protein ligase A
LLVYSRDRPCISVGRFQKVEDAVNVLYAEDNGISVVRRVSGGSSIYSDAGQMTYSLVISKERLPNSREGSFAVICGALVAALGILGIEAVHKPVNDVLVNGRKISGGAQARSKSAVLQHGSLILDVDESVVSSSLKQVKSRPYDGLTSIKECLGRVPSRDAISDAIMNGFSETFGHIRRAELTGTEKERIRRSADLLLI